VHLLCSTQLEPEWATARLNLGNTFAWMRYPDKALDAYTQAVQLDPALTEAYRMLGHAFYARGDFAKASSVFRQLLSIEPDNAIAEHMLAATSGENVPDRASQAYVEETFDSFASSFDAKLARLEYRGPQLVADELARLAPEPAGALRCLDLGAGTGLCGPLVKPWTSTMIGVDLSPKMLERAARREVYDELVVSDLETYLRGEVGAFDLMVSADVIIYFGALDSLLFNAVRRLSPGGWLIFTLERASARLDDAFELGPHGRYMHGGEYVDTKLREAGLEVVARSEHVIRRELAESVKGWLVTARMPTAPAVEPG
jgi:predicted TPR repeat methyltransferase